MVIRGDDGRPWQVVNRDLRPEHWLAPVRLWLHALEAERVRSVDLPLTAPVELVRLAERPLEFLYWADTGGVFLDPATGDQYDLPTVQCGERAGELALNTRVLGGFHRGRLRVVEVV
jgi:translation elongation factor P/translation initiation factor 5A